MINNDVIVYLKAKSNTYMIQNIECYGLYTQKRSKYNTLIQFTTWYTKPFKNH